MTTEPEPRPTSPDLDPESEQDPANPQQPQTPEFSVEPVQGPALPEPRQDAEVGMEPEQAPAVPEPQAPDLGAAPEQGPAVPDLPPPVLGAAPASPEEKERIGGRSWLRLALLVLLLGGLTLLASVLVFRFVDPPFTTVMVAEKIKGTTLRRQWVPLERISPNLRLAVIASEDGRFCEHWGVDWGAVRDAVEESRLGGFRGASTITMQTAKNLYLWTERSYVRKIIELPLAYLLTALWPKERVMEVYLNIAQWGPGVFGAEAASRYYFGKSASGLTRREELLLAVSLPSPRLRNPGRPSARLVRIARAVERRMPTIAARAACVRPQATETSRGSGQDRRKPL
jgi:monofunctional biosynthetic peptidoglycan transglycosylase